MVSTRGPIPQRSDERVGHGSPKSITKASSAKNRPSWPSPDPDWHSTARNWYLSLSESGQSVFYEASDMAFCYFVAEELSAYKLGEKGGAMYFSALLSAMNSTLSTEADRRRAGIELGQEKDETTSAAEKALEIYRNRPGMAKKKTEAAAKAA